MLSFRDTSPVRYDYLKIYEKEKAGDVNDPIGPIFSCKNDKEDGT